MVYTKLSKIGMNLTVMFGVGAAELPFSHSHHEGKDNKHYQDSEKPESLKSKVAVPKTPEKPETPGGEKPEVPPHSRRIESRVQATEEEIEQSIGAKGDNKRGQRGGGNGGTAPDPAEGETARISRSRRSERTLGL